ncbi:heat shock protein Hsp-12.2-like isoform X2 [Agrilus planipennis]|uniref:Heat shock protein Hsp-12.2-like isoform X1 n=1 Tax=Agrilus planipennis TaxID=224129 RepID=A0A1W4WUW1_AGRPL|nr:heat shock protein Hsp-12.2-like isoform X1 [Agrilus planipennis]XP_018324287.1 heat shock protein Hsp-12.2-like isoform X2 [Agrilus planipennis]
MSLIPWHTTAPSRALDPYFGLRLDDDDLLAPLTLAPWETRAPWHRRWPLRSYYNWESLLPTDTGSTIKEDKDRFQLDIDVQHFKPEEIKVTSSGNTLTVEGKHEEKPDEHGYISRHFVRRYALPEDHDLSQVQSHLSSDGVLTIIAPKVPDDGNAARSIPIQHTGKPKRAISFK